MILRDLSKNYNSLASRCYGGKWCCAEGVEEEEKVIPFFFCYVRDEVAYVFVFM